MAKNASEILAEKMLEFPDIDAPKRLSRGMFPISFRCTVEALLMGDAKAPILTSNSVRNIDGGLDENSIWERCLEQVKGLLALGDSDLKDRMCEVAELTRIAPSKTEERKRAQGMMFSSGQELIRMDAALKYVFLWAIDLSRGMSDGTKMNVHQYTGMTFDVDTEGVCATRKNGRMHLGEYVIPVCIFNSRIRQVLATFDIDPEKSTARHLYLRPDREGVDIYSTHLGIQAIDHNDFPESGEQIATIDNSISVNATNREIEELLEKLLTS